MKLFNFRNKKKPVEKISVITVPNSLNSSHPKPSLTIEPRRLGSIPTQRQVKLTVRREPQTLAPKQQTDLAIELLPNLFQEVKTLIENPNIDSEKRPIYQKILETVENDFNNRCCYGSDCQDKCLGEQLLLLHKIAKTTLDLKNDLSLKIARTQNAPVQVPKYFNEIPELFKKVQRLRWATAESSKIIHFAQETYDKAKELFNAPNPNLVQIMDLLSVVKRQLYEAIQVNYSENNSILLHAGIGHPEAAASINQMIEEELPFPPI